MWTSLGVGQSAHLASLASVGSCEASCVCQPAIAALSSMTKTTSSSWSTAVVNVVL
jgi:hypothetical protein